METELEESFYFVEPREDYLIFGRVIHRDVDFADVQIYSILHPEGSVYRCKLSDVYEISESSFNKAKQLHWHHENDPALNQLWKRIDIA